MDAEDRMFIRVVGSRAVKTLRSRNPKLWMVFKERCEENGEKPDAVLGRTLYRFAKSVVEEDGEFADELLGKVINISAFRKREDILSKVDELINIKKKLEQSSSSKLDSLIETLIEKEIARASTSPVDAMIGGMQQQQAQAQQGRIVIDENTLAQLDPNSLEALEKLVKKVKSEKLKLSNLTAEQVEELLGGDVGDRKEEGKYEEKGEGEEEEEELGSGHSEGSEGDSERAEELSE